MAEYTWYFKKIFKRISLLAISFYLMSCSMSVDITKNSTPSAEAKKAAGTEMTSGSNRQKTNRGYIVESQIGHSFGAVYSKTDHNYSVYHSTQLGSSSE
jgi:hypothetical protein